MKAIFEKEKAKIQAEAESKLVQKQKEIADKAEKSIAQAKEQLVKETNKAKEAETRALALKDQMTQLEMKAEADHK